MPEATKEGYKCTIHCSNHVQLASELENCVVDHWLDTSKYRSLAAVSLYIGWSSTSSTVHTSKSS